MTDGWSSAVQHLVLLVDDDLVDDLKGALDWAHTGVEDTTHPARIVTKDGAHLLHVVGRRVEVRLLLARRLLPAGAVDGPHALGEEAWGG